ncbi:MAG: hypothetical protein SFY67_04005 [Candidatus Melainabacteria bacterium]|nr:hypothetical protein [Candidatus Melainabacteria bacterium]
MPKLNGSSILTIVAVILISAGIATMYLSAESGLYWSDYNYYQFIVKTVRDAFVENPLTGMALIVYSTKLLYNFLFTIPLLPVSLIFGDNRYAFIISQVVLFQIPAALILASLVNNALKTQSNKMVWIAFTVFMTQPALWACSLRGYPDAIALLCLLLSFYYCQKMQENSTFKNTLTTGVFLALSPILRRHYAYGAIATATSFFAVFYQEKKDLKRTIVQLSKIAFVSIIFLLTVGIGFVMSIFSEPFLNLYTAACIDPIGIAGYYISGFGLTTWLLCITGIVLAFKSELFDRNKFNSLMALAVLMVLDWILFGKHLAIHYLLYAAPIVVLGCSAFFYILSNSKRKIVVWLTAPFLLLNFALGILPYEQLPAGLTRYGMLTMPLNEPNISGRLVTANFGPLTRSDQEQMGLLLKDLKEMGSAFQPIFIVSGNQILCPDILRNYQRINERSADFPKYIEPPILNTRDALPLGALLTCNSVVLAHPFIPMYKPESSTILSLVLDCFDKKWPISEDFEKSDFQAKLDNNSEITVYKRTRQTSPQSAVKALVEMKKILDPDFIFGQPSWISSTEPYEPTGKEYQKSFAVTDGFLLSAKTYKNKTSIEGKVESRVNATNEISVTLFDESGNSVFESEPKQIRNEFEIALPKLNKDCYAVIKVASKASKIILSDLALN